MDLTTLLRTQRAAFDAERPVPPAIRKDRIGRAIRMLVDNADAFCAALSADFGHRSREQSMLTDVIGSVRALKHARKHVDRWVRPERRRLDFPLGLLGARAAVEYQPKGVVGVIAPWNFPVQLTMAPLAGILAAGNRAMVKSSEFTPRTAALFEQLAGRYFDPAELAFVSGGAEAGRAFSALPFDHLIFTGATGIGRHILHAAADNLTPVTLELGGKSPTVIGRSADIGQATTRIATGKLMNAGQICLAPDYLLVPNDKEDAVIAGLTSAAAALYPRLLDNPDYTALVNERHHVRLQSYLDDARAKGGDVIEVNPAREDFAASNGTKMPLFIVRNPTDEMAVMQDEIFGPVLPVRRYGTIDEAIDFVNGRDRPLGLYYFGSDAAEERRVLDRTISGGVTINDVIFHISAEELPFGGVGPSGMGAYHGFDGFRTFSHARAVYRQPRIDIARLAGIKPPYGATTAKTIARELKI
ncbi:aldehyde dehydrogenase family protein [Sphingomonas sp. MAH-20]|uniref:Aldehyde dehydrogenase n=2 Tax=Sphingomonadaceae TaxID=41297 RepID=A0A6I4J0D5_9SPHN|nr:MULTISPECIES: coniferyl aldehyde dehydrogenase [Sphingomonas]MBA2918556.1 coniferyl aldehyde dehydrogenase [Sphingomonas sp. CGMCC 1.13658]MVO77523.1 aldehyde dehydrogenase family protein [Sphingomonas horti]